jgi:cytoskeletal protein RodZ
MNEEEKQAEAKVPTAKAPKTTGMNKKAWLTGFIVLVLVAGIGVLAWQYKTQSDAKKQAESAKKTLQSQVDALTKQLAEAKATASSSGKAATTPKTCTISSSLKENAAASISSMNTAALEGYMAASVNVVFAASEKAGARTPTQAVADLDYVNSNAVGPWNFDLSAATLASYKAGFYGQYFGDNTIVGKSSNGYVVAFGVDANCKISVVFVAASADLLTQ